MIAGTVAVSLFALLYWKVLPESLRAWALLLFGMGMYRDAAPSIAVNLALILVVILVLRMASADRRGPIAVVLTVLALLLTKYARIPGFQVVGLSYVSFRLISLSREIEKQKAPAPSSGRTLLYTLFPATFLSGPIEPYGRFSRAAVPATLSRSDLFASLFRVSIGLAKKLLFVEPLRSFAEANLRPALPESALWPGLFAYSLFVYLDFSAYSDLAIGGGRLFGYPIGENFNWPYLSANISEFWTRWHISLSQFLRDHVFLPVSARALRVKGLAGSPVLVGSAASLVTMTLCGMWHGDRLSFAAWGLGHGGLLAAHQFHRQKLLGGLPAKRRMKLQSHRLYRAVATLATFVSVTLLWVPFRFSIPESMVVYGKLFSALVHLVQKMV